MADRIERLLTDVRAEASTKLDDLAAAALIAELRAHLEASAAAYVEVGMTPDEADRAAVEAFGAVDGLATQVSERTEPRRFSAPPLAWAGAILGLGILSITFAWLSDRGAILSLHFTLLLLGAFAFSSARRRRAETLRLTGLGLGATLVLTIIMTLTWLRPHGWGHGVLPRREYAKSVARLERDDRDHRLLDAGRAAFGPSADPRAIEPFRQGTGYLTPSGYSWEQGVTWTTQPTLAAAAQTWQAAGRNGTYQNLERASEELPLYRAAISGSPWPWFAPNLTEIAPAGMAATLLLVTVNAMAVGFGNAFRRLRRRGPRPRAV